MMKRFNRPAHGAGVVAVLAAAFLAAAAGAQWTVTVLHPPGAVASSALGGTDRRQCGYALIGETRRATVWTIGQASVLDLHPAGTTRSEVRGMWADQQVGTAVVPEVDPSYPCAILWNGTAHSWVNLNPSNSWWSEAHGVEDGVQVGKALSVDGPQACLWRGTAGSIVYLDRPGMLHIFSSCDAIGDGQQVGWFVVVEDNSSQHAALWSGTPESWIDLHPPGAYYSFATGVSRGQQVGYVGLPSDGWDHAVLWTGSVASMVDLAPPSAPLSRAFAVHEGIQAGWAGRAEDPEAHGAAMWHGTAESYVDLHRFLPQGYRWSEARAVARQGEVILISGSGFNTAAGREEALLWTFTPTPPRLGDFNADGFIDFFDYDDFVGCFEGAGCPAGRTADFNGDGFVDLADYSAFVEAFETGS